MFSKLRFILFVLLFPWLCSCEDKEMVAKSDEQAKRIEALRAELSVQKIKLDANWERDPSGDLEQTEHRIEELKGKISDLENELDETEKERDAAEKSFEDYRKKYPVG